MEHVKTLAYVIRELAANPLTAFVSPLNSADMEDNPYGNPPNGNNNNAPGAEATAPHQQTTDDTNPNPNVTKGTATNGNATNGTAAAASPTPFKRAEYHTGLAYNCLHRLNLLVTKVQTPLGLTDDCAILLTKRNFEALIETCRRIAASLELSQDKEIAYLEKKMEDVEEMRVAWLINKAAEDWRMQNRLGGLNSEEANGKNGGGTR
ncbi:hypothetical protein B0T20DRAFT_397563 [Sordaria brevicollis]|uniref:Uncharacterized protein n=1 Tax=Sordaria brevicollis TaxID=83679 RepID=A0AAE0NVT1_SORBR|nr:hypothetical protein B0T20DRAFT_397563 [Sordaria brevicollis]